MGSNQFQREYIEYLQKLNTDLLNRLNNMKENYECKVLSKDWNRSYLIPTLEEVLNICTVVPQEIDLFFEKISEAMGTFKNILLRKSEMLQLMEKISKALNSTVNFNSDLMKMDDSDLVKTQFPESRVGKKAGTAKVSPMINGHVILTEPRIQLNRVPGMFLPTKRAETYQLSPIIEASPGTSSEPSNSGSPILKEVKVSLERINPSRNPYSYISGESPKIRFKGPKTWKKSLSSRKLQDQTNTVFLEKNDNSIKKLSAENGDLSQLENIDPQEGPSWLYQDNSDINSSSSCYMDYRRRKHRFATAFENDKECLSFFEKKSKKLIKGGDEFHESHGEANEKEEFQEVKKRVSESSDDFIFESFSSEREENYSPLEKRRRKTKRRSKGSSDKRHIEKFSRDFEKRTSTPYSNNKKKKCVSNSPVYSDSYEENGRNSVSTPIQHRKFSKSSPEKLLSERLSADISFEKTPSKTESGKGKGQIRKKSVDAKKKTLEKESLRNELFDESEGCVVDKKKSSGRSKTGSVIEEKNFKSGSSKSQSRSPVVILQENLGRVKRKAAPTFKLVEPKLGTKLRRN